MTGRRRKALPAHQQAALERAAASITRSAQFARITDSATRGHINYASLCGGLEGIVLQLVRDLVGHEAAAPIERAFGEAYDESSDVALAAFAGRLRVTTPTTNASTR